MIVHGSTICIRRTPLPEAAEGANLINGPIEVFQLFYEKMRIGRISSKLLKLEQKISILQRVKIYYILLFIWLHLMVTLKYSSI